MNQYFNDIREGIRTTLTGLKLTLRHFWQARHRRRPISVQDSRYFEQQTGMVTLQYPFETLPIPDNGRYRLHNEIDDCIVCDKCAKICPVDCIAIDAVKATEEVGKASDGSPIRLYAATFDIDMAKCCYCGLCTTVCPTECLTMTKTYDFSEYELGNMTYHFANLSPDQAEEKRRLYEQFVREKEELKARQVAAKATETAQAMPADVTAVARKPVFRPGMKPNPPKPEAEEIKPDAQAAASEPSEAPTAKPRPVFRPGMKPAAPKPTESVEEGKTEKPVASEPATPKPAFRPTMKPAAPKPEENLPTKEVSEPTISGELAPDAEVPKPRPAFRPTMKPKSPPPDEP